VLEMGGLDGHASSESLVLKQLAGYRRLLIEANPRWRAARLARSPDAIGVTAAVCERAQKVHYVIPGTRIARRHTGRNLELMGGIAELQPEAMVRKNAPLAAALQEARGDWASVNWTKLGTTMYVHPVACRPLAAILDAVGVHTFALGILDVEGAELAVLRAVDWERVRFGILVIEADSPYGTREHAYKAQVTALMGSTGQYRLLYQRGRNLWFAHRSLVAHARSPADLRAAYAAKALRKCVGACDPAVQRAGGLVDTATGWTYGETGQRWVFSGGGV